MIFIAAGSNLPFGEAPSQHLVTRAFAVLDRIVQVKAVSPLYRSPSWPDPDDPPYVNAAALVETAIGPRALLAALHAVEAGFARRRSARNAPRTLDLDLIAYHGVRCDDGPQGLRLPHPRYAGRDFVLAPLCDLAPDWRDPETGKSAREMLAALKTRAAERLS